MNEELIEIKLVRLAAESEAFMRLFKEILLDTKNHHFLEKAMKDLPHTDAAHAVLVQIGGISLKSSSQ